MFDLLFLLCFTLHNIEEALWLPDWSRHASRFHRPVKAVEFRFAVLAVTVLGYVLCFLSLAWGQSWAPVRYAWYGFVLMMCINAVFPHLAATIALRRYAPGVLTGLALNLPVGLYLVFVAHGQSPADPWLWLATFAVAGPVLLSLGPLFRLGARLHVD